MPDNELKAACKKYGIFFGIMAGMTAVVLCVSLLAHGSWRHGLAQTAQTTLDTYFPGAYVVGDFLEIKSTMTTSAAVFAVRRADVAERPVCCVIVRIPTVAGALPALFLYEPRDGVQFVGYALDLGKAAHVLNRTVQGSTIAYWQKRIPLMLEKAGVQ
ncbi:MAG: hypothetical protein K2J14_06970 [Treponemataceae bacterium]|nr:hypothetical protein [Treponemataceae bacterium]